MAKPICIIESDSEVRNYFGSILKEKGHQALFFESGNLAFEGLLESISQGNVTPQFFLVNNLLPDYTGLSFCQKIRSLNSFHHTPIVIYSAFQNSDEQSRLPETKGLLQKFLSRPFKPESFEEILTSFSNEDEEENQPPAKGPMQLTPFVSKTIPLEGTLSCEGIDLPQVICRIFREQLTGSLEVKHGDLSRFFFFEKGKVVFSEGNGKGDRFLNFLKLQKAIPEDKLNDAELIAGDSDENLQNTLIELKILDAYSLFKLEEKFIKHLILSTFIWEEGEFQFSIDDSHLGSFRLDMETPLLLYHGISNSFDEPRILSQMGEGNWVLSPKPNYQDGLQKMKFGPAQSRVALLANGARTVNDVLSASSLPELETLHILYTLFCLGYSDAFQTSNF